MGQFSQHVMVRVTDNGLLTIEDGTAHVLLQEFALQKIVPSSKAAIRHQTGPFTYAHPFTMHFGKPIPVRELIDALMKTGVFKFVEPDFMGEAHGLCEVAPDDSLFARQWSLHNTGKFNAKSVEDADIDMNHAWTITTGSTSVVVAILDSGIDPDHPEFKGRIWQNSAETTNNNIDDDNNGYRDDAIGWDFANHDNDPTDDHGHGINVTGIIGATGDNKTGYAGADWKCKLMTCKVLDASGRGQFSWWVDALYYAVENGADVINMSLGGSNGSLALETAVNYAYEKNVPVVVSMGNDNSQAISYPAGYTSTIGVGATDTDNERVSPFFWGGGSSYGNHMDFSAPGNYIYGLHINRRYGSYWGGTSQSAPLVTGVVSLLLGLKPNLTVDSVETYLCLGAKDQVGRTTEDTPGWDIFHGHGIVNAYKTLLLATGKTISACDSFTLNGKKYDSTTAIFDTIFATSCNSLGATLTNIQTSPSRKYQVSACDSFEWMDGKVYKSSVSQARHLSPNTEGCDSVHLLSLDLKRSSFWTEQVSACEPYTWIDGKTYTRDEYDATYVLRNHHGCDSTVKLHLSMGRHSTSTQQVNACGESYTWINGETYTASGTFLASYVFDHKGCDSTVWLHLKLRQLDTRVVEKDQKLSTALPATQYQWLDCDQAKTPIPSANQREFSPAKSGRYAVAIENDGCQDTSACHDFMLSSLDEIATQFFEVFPNPFDDRFKITFHETLPNVTLTLVNQLGQTIDTQHHSQVSAIGYELSEKPSGIYYLRIEVNNEHFWTQKLIRH